MYTVKIANINEFNEQKVKIIIHDGTPIAVFKVENEFFAIDNRCPHRGASLGDGPIQDEIITCIWHSWKFSLKTGQAIENPNCFIKTFPIIIDGDIIKLVYDSKR
ncbi:MAG: Rieske 2Fe-2S domain-containing protein [Candidatus Marinimicrobia bacterium]|nr:Rieske 2Fe-2S domain-containing protein [Candidatus Neomarinimicrobiota bacterium]